MSGLTAQQRSEIENIVGTGRARFDVRERRLYSKDAGVVPGPLRRLAGGTLADGVAQPENEAQIVSLVRYAAEHDIPLTPRGKGTSGYGGAVPARNGLVLDLTRLTGVEQIDAERLTVTVRAGTVWSRLEEVLGEHGLSLRMYPSSAPGSTVGGWLAQGGAGIGSHQYGWFAANISAARIVTGRAEVQLIEGDAVSMVSDAEGTTGIITAVTLPVRRATHPGHILAAWPHAASLEDALKLVSGQQLPIWSITFVNPTMARLKQAARQLGGAASAAVLEPPAGRFSALLSLESEHWASVHRGVDRILRATGGELLSATAAQAAWDERFRPMRVKRLGPSLVPVEIVVPVSSLADVLQDLERTTSAPLALEGLSVRGNEVVLLGFIPHDERTLAYTFGYAAALSATRIAEHHHGRAYSTGRYFAHHAERILGARRVAALRTAKDRNDPHRILNPGKVFTGSTSIALATNLEPVLRTVARVAGRPRPAAERLRERRGFPGDVATYAYACAHCAYCIDVCPQFQDDGWESSSPRGKWSFLKSVLEGHDRFDNAMTDVFELCSRCGKCDTACQIELPVLGTWGSLHRTLWQGMLTRTS